MKMQMIKIIMLFLIFFLSNAIGKMFATKYNKRWQELKEMKNALNIFKTKIKFTYEPIPEIFEEISKNTKKEISEIFLDAQKNMESETAGKAWELAIEKNENHLEKEDKETLKMLSKMLGESDLNGQICQIDVTLSFLDKQLDDAEKEKNKNEGLYRKLGTIMGLTLVIILV